MRNGTILLGLTLLLSACAADDIGADESNVVSATASAKTKTLSPPVAVPSDTDIGRGIAEIVARETGSAEKYDSRTYEECTIDSYARDGKHVAEVQDCTDDDVIVRVWTGEEEDPRFANLIWADHDYDGRVDSHRDESLGGLSVHDDNHDGQVDRHIESFERLGDDFVIEGYEAGWIPPEYPAKRILEDTNFDGAFDSESVTGGRDPEGNLSWWTKTGE